MGYQNAQCQAPARIIATFSLSKGTRKEILSRITGIKREEEAFRKVEFIFDLIPDKGFIISQITAEWPESGMVAVAYAESPNGHQYSYFAIGPDQSGTPLGSIGLSKRIEGAVDRALESLHVHSNELRPLWDAFNNWRSRFYHFKALRGGSPRSMELSSQSLLDPTGSNLPAVLLDLQTNRSLLMDKLRSIISQMVPDVGRLETPTQSNRLSVAFTDPFNGGFQHNLKELGTGVEQLLLTLVVGLTEKSPSTLVVEEPETNLHPAAQRALLSLLKEWASDRLIIAATHSPVMLDWAPGGNQLWQITRSNGISQLSMIDEPPLELLRSLGVRISDVLSADRILVVEGPSDIDVLNTWFPEIMRNPRVSVIPGGGGDNARFANLFVEWLTHSDRLGARHVLYLRDRDELTPEVVDKLTRAGNVYVLGCREIENYLLSPDAITSVLARESGLKCEATPEAVQELIHQSIEELKPFMVVNRVARRLPGVRLVDNQMRGTLAKSGASEEDFWEVIKGRLPDPNRMRSDLRDLWEVASREVSEMTEEQLIKWAPGEEILDGIYMHFLGRRFKKTKDGGELAAAIENPPVDLAAALERFMSDNDPEPS